MKQVPVTEEKVRDILSEFRDEIFERLDDISGQLETIRDEQTIGYHQFKQLEGKVENHEKRIAAIEPPHS